jgi:hypothetical protein
MKNLNKVIAEDLKAAFASFKDDSFDNVNIFGNRIMANAIFGDDSKIFLPGFFVKDVGLTFLLLKARKSAMAFSTAKSYGFSYVESLIKALENLNEEQLWKDYQEFNNKIRKFEMSEWEEKTYTDDEEFTTESFKWLLSYLNSHKETFSIPTNSIIKGTINEMERIEKVHGAKIRDLILLQLMIALDRNYEYVCRFPNDPNAKTSYDKQLKELILPNVDRIITLGNKEFTIQEADTFLWDLVKTWRRFFIEYGEFISASVAIQKGIELPEDLKKKLTESITKSVEKQL